VARLLRQLAFDLVDEFGMQVQQPVEEAEDQKQVLLAVAGSPPPEPATPCVA